MNLCLFTSNYPYGNSEPFIDNEINHLSKKFNKKVIPEMSIWNVSNPRYQSIGNVVEGIFNVPMGRTINKINNIKQALDSENQTWQRIALMLGWNTWDLGVTDKEIEQIKGDVSSNKKSNKKRNSIIYKGGGSKKSKKKSKNVVH